MIRIAIIEDEPKMAQALKTFINSIANNANILFEANSIVSAVEKMETYKIDCAFLMWN